MPEPVLVVGPIARHLRRIQNSADPGVAALGAKWQREVNRTVKRWRAEVEPVQLATIEAQIEAAVHGGSASAIANLQVAASGVDMIYESMQTMAAAGAAAVVAEAKRQGVTIELPPPLASTTLAEWAQIAADVLTSGLVATAASEALRLFRPGATAAGVVAGVKSWLGGLTDRRQRDVIGGGLTRAQNLGRLQAYAAPRPADVELQLIADETLDANTCKPCRRIDGTILPTPEAAALAYGGAGYLFCQGRDRCRGTVRGVWQRVERPADTYGALFAGLVTPGRGPHTQDHDLPAAGRMAR